MAEGTKLDAGKNRYDLLAPEALEGIVKVLTFGATKYSARNWENGFAWGRSFAALMRHMWEWWKGNSIDPETGLSHLDHAACNIHFLQTFEKRSIGTDDRPQKNLPQSGGCIGNEKAYRSRPIGGVRWNGGGPRAMEVNVSLPDATGYSLETPAARTERWLQSEPDSMTRRAMLWELDNAIASGTRTELSPSTESAQSHTGESSSKYTK